MPSHLSQTLAQLQQRMHQILQAQNLLEFETVELPFQLVEAGIRLWESLYSPESLQQLAQSDPDTLDAWAIALSQTLQNQLDLLNRWQSSLGTLPVPPLLKQKIEARIQKFSQLAQEKSRLFEELTPLLQQEQQLRQEAEELSVLKEKEKALQQIQADLKAIDLERLRQSLSTQVADLKLGLQEVMQPVNSYYQTQIEEIKTQLNAQFQSDRELVDLLPVDRQKVEALTQNIQESLGELERELTAAQRQHEQHHQKPDPPYTF